MVFILFFVVLTGETYHFLYECTIKKERQTEGIGCAEVKGRSRGTGEAMKQGARGTMTQSQAEREGKGFVCAGCLGEKKCPPLLHFGN